MIGHHTRLRENDDLPLWRGPAVKKKPPFFNARTVLIMHEIMRSTDAILGNDLKVRGDIVPGNSCSVSYCLFSRIGTHF